MAVSILIANLFLVRAGRLSLLGGNAKAGRRNPARTERLDCVSVEAQGGTGVPPVSDETEKAGGTPVPLSSLLTFHSHPRRRFNSRSAHWTSS